MAQNTTIASLDATPPVDEELLYECVQFDFGLTRRGFVAGLGAGLMIVAIAGPALGQSRPSGGDGRGRGGGGRRTPEIPLGSRLHIGKDGIITVMTGKVEGGQGSRTEISQAAAEELECAVEHVKVMMADTAQTPDDGITAGSRTTPSNLPPIRQACAAARQLLVAAAAEKWGVPLDQIKVHDGGAHHDGKRFDYAALAASELTPEAMKRMIPSDIELTAVDQRNVLGTSVPRPNRKEIVTGAHQYPSDVIRPGMLYAKILRPPGYGAKLTSIDLAPAKAIEGVVVVHDGDFVAAAAPTTFLAKKAILALEKTARWEQPPHPPSSELRDYLRKNAPDGAPANPFAEQVKSASKSLKATYHIPYIQHTPMEPRAAVAEVGDDGTVTIWTGNSNPFRARGEVASALRLPEEKIRIIVPDYGGGFGGKHSAETAVEAARIALAAKKPVAVRWTREEEFTWASFRPAAEMDLEATLDDAGTITTWFHSNINAGRPSLESPYRLAKAETPSANVNDPPLRHGSYRALASTGNVFAREAFMDELAELAGKDPLDFRLAHLDNPRLRAVLENAAEKFKWREKRSAGKRSETGGEIGVGLSCGTDKGGFVAACAEVAVNRADGSIRILRVTQSFECGAIQNPENLLNQVQGAIVQAIGPILREQSTFEDGRITNATLWQYAVPRFADVPQLDIHLLDRKDLPASGAGETPLIALAPAVANAVFHATGQRLRELPLKLSSASQATRYE
jgi:isoquinoline 1-oxidoreductase